MESWSETMNRFSNECEIRNEGEKKKLSKQSKLKIEKKKKLKCNYPLFILKLYVLKNNGVCGLYQLTIHIDHARIMAKEK